jgi:thiol-disulfide isomerase/thioredoxin
MFLASQLSTSTLSAIGDDQWDFSMRRKIFFSFFGFKRVLVKCKGSIILLQLFAPWCLTCLPFKDSSYNFGEKKLKHLAQLSATLSIHVMSHL